MEDGGIYPSGRDAALNVLLAQLFNRTQQAWIGANMDTYDQGLADFTDALRSFGSGEVNSVALAMVKKGLDAPMGQKENQLYSYAARQIVENGKNQTKAENAKFSIKQLPDGTQYVHVDADQNIFDNAKNSDYQKIVRQYIRDHFKGNQYRINQTGENIRITGRSAKEYAYPANRRMSENVKNAKMRASTELDEMIAVSRFLEHKNDDGRHIQATGGWNHYNTLFEVGGHFFQGETQIMLTDEGPLFYDITKIEDITSPLRTANKMDSRGRDNASEENIADHKRNVNENFSVKRDADQNQRNREDAENLIQDAELYAQVMSDEDVRAAVQAFANVMDAVNKMTGDSAVRGAWQERLDEYASQIITETGSEINKRN